MKASSILLQGLVLGTTASLLVGCGANKSTVESSSLSSSVPNSVLTADKSIAYCSQAAATQGDVDVTLTAYFDVYGTANNRYVRLKFRNIPAAYNTQGWDLEMYRWTASTDGQTSLDSTLLYYHPERYTASGLQKIIPNGYPGANGYQLMNFSEAQQIATFGGFDGTTPQTLFNTMDLLVDLKDSSGAYKALRVVFRETNGAVARQIDVLIPAFYADPAVYGLEKPTVLQNLHPLKAQKGAAFSQSQFQAMTNAFCM